MSGSDWTGERVARLLLEARLILLDPAPCHPHTKPFRDAVLRSLREAAEALSKDAQDDADFIREVREGREGHADTMRAVQERCEREFGSGVMFCPKCDKAWQSSDDGWRPVPDVAPRPRWEYTVHSAPINNDGLDEMGALGWELVQCDHDNLMYFKRRLAD